MDARNTEAQRERERERERERDLEGRRDPTWVVEQVMMMRLIILL